jgi:hypothetical protein
LVGTTDDASTAALSASGSGFERREKRSEIAKGFVISDS